MVEFYEKQWLFLKKSVFLNKLSHAYLFSGRDSLEMESFARQFARLINCQSQDFVKKPCGQCLSCREFAKGCLPDFLWLEKPAEEDSQINLVRDLCLWLSLRPAIGDFKIAIINKIETFSWSSQSALLKTLEEPRGKTILILIANFADLLLKTILSRVQEIKFPPRTSQKPEPEDRESFEQMMREGLTFSFQKVKGISGEKDQSLQFLERLMTISRQEKASSRFLKTALKTYYLIGRTNTNPRLALENLMLELF